MTATVDPTKKPAYKSKTIWGALIAAVGICAQEIPQEWLTEVLARSDKIAEILGLVLVVYGRIRAKVPIGKEDAP